MGKHLLNSQWHRLGHGTHSDGAGLELENLPPRGNSKSTSKSWKWRGTYKGSRVPVQIGSAKKMPLAVAREHAEMLNAAVLEGKDPRVVWAEFKNPTPKADYRIKTLVEDFFQVRWGNADRSSGEVAKIMKNEKNVHTYFSGLRNKVVKPLGEFPIYDVTAEQLARDVFGPYFRESFSMGEKTAQRLMLVYDRAATLERGNPHRLNRQIVRDALNLIGYEELEKQHKAKRKSKANKVGMVSVEPTRLPDAYARLGDDFVFHAVRFLILTVQRVGSLTLAKWDEFDWDAKEWRIPYDQLKWPEFGDLVVPLSDAAMASLTELRKVNGDQRYVMHSAHACKTGLVSSQTLLDRLESVGISDEDGDDAHTHGFRGSFRTWADEVRVGTHAELEWSLHHKFWGSETESAYHKGDRARYALDARRDVLNLWADYAEGKVDLADLKEANRAFRREAEILQFRRAG